MRDALASCFDERFAEGPKTEEESGPLRVRFNCLKIVVHFVCELHSGDLHQFRKFTHHFDIDADPITPDGNGDQFSGMTDTEVQLSRHSPVAPRIEQRFSMVVADECYIASRTVKVFTQ